MQQRGFPAQLRLSALALCIATCSSCVTARYTLRPLDIPNDLDRYLASREAAFPGIIPGTEKTIEWAGERGAKTPLSVVFIHGFSGSRQDLKPVFEGVAKELGANFHATRLYGHGIDGDAIGDATLDDWVNDAREAFEIGKRLGDRVIVGAMSMGSDLSLWLASQKPPELASLVLVSAAIKLANRSSEIVLLPFGRSLLAMASPLYIQDTPRNETHARYSLMRYRREAIVPLMAAIKLGRKIDLGAITVPSLWLYTDKDTVVDLEALKNAYARIGSVPKKLINIPRAGHHVLAGDMISPETTGEAVATILAFLSEAGVR